MKYFFSFLLLFSFFLSTKFSFSQVYTRSWMNTYGSDSVLYDFAPIKMCSSTDGFIYVISNKDTVGGINLLALTKYDGIGNLIWERIQPMLGRLRKKQPPEQSEKVAQHVFAPKKEAATEAKNAYVTKNDNGSYTITGVPSGPISVAAYTAAASGQTSRHVCAHR